MQSPNNANTRQAGFSLLEMVVAVAILGISLATLYEAVGGATRIVRVDRKYAFGVELAQSVLANYQMVPAAGVSDSGETPGGFRWEVESAPVTFLENNIVQPGTLQEVKVQVSWRDGNKTRRVVLDSVVAGFTENQFF